MEEIARGKAACSKVPVGYGFLKLAPEDLVALLNPEIEENWV